MGDLPSNAMNRTRIAAALVIVAVTGGLIAMVLRGRETTRSPGAESGPTTTSTRALHEDVSSTSNYALDMAIRGSLSQKGLVFGDLAYLPRSKDAVASWLAARTSTRAEAREAAYAAFMKAVADAPPIGSEVLRGRLADTGERLARAAAEVTPGTLADLRSKLKGLEDEVKPNLSVEEAWAIAEKIQALQREIKIAHAIGK